MTSILSGIPYYVLEKKQYTDIVSAKTNSFSPTSQECEHFLYTKKSQRPIGSLGFGSRINNYLLEN